VIWNERFVAKIAKKHVVSTDEVEKVLFSRPQVRRLEKGKVKGEHLYAAYGQTGALPISAREMTGAERRYFHEQKKEE
jgi:uncharacterized DUF497 family protein